MKSLKSQISLAALGYGLEKLIALVVVTVLVRHIDKALMGRFFVAISVCTVAAMFVEFGSARYLVRATAQNTTGAATYLAGVLRFRLPLMVFALVAINFIVALIAPELLWIYIFTSVYILFENLYYAFGSTLLGIGAVAARVATGLIGPLCLLALVPAATLLGWPLQRIVVLYAASSTFMALVACWIVVRRIGPIPVVHGEASVRDILGQCSLLLAVNTTVMLHARIDEWMLAAMRDFREVAGYAVAYKVAEVSRSAIRPMTMVLFPHFAAAVSRNEWNTVQAHAMRALGGAAVMGMLVAVCVILTAPWVVPLLFGRDYPESVTIMGVLFLATPALFVGFVATSINLSLHLDKELLGFAAASLALNFTLNLAAIPRWGAIGAAWTTVITESLFCVGIVALLVMKLRPLVARWARPEPQVHPTFAKAVRVPGEQDRVQRRSHG